MILRDRKKSLGATLDWLCSAPSCHKQELNFDISFSTVHKYRMAGIKAVVRALQDLKFPSKVSSSLKSKCPYFDKALCTIDGDHFPLTVSKDDAERFRNRKGWISTNILIASDWKCAKLLPMIPDGFYAIADAEFEGVDAIPRPMCACFLLHNFIRHVDQDDLAQDLEELPDVVDRPPMDSAADRAYDDLAAEQREDEPEYTLMYMVELATLPAATQLNT
ncbi:hypothetical protein P43SY_011317 [Pythium insidiosum]|uniref:DDE Tnp4 domain-containing protein n=1 Tax=Pythium insidiosum TaxID=114742 RepID=A0AAD5Q1S9_PYTIN|nr:hypothetical protein P43SY_011317 [Pythium insidiosum]